MRLIRLSAGITAGVASPPHRAGHHFDRRDLRRGGAHRILDRQLEGDRRRRAALAAARELQPDHALAVDLEQMDVAAVRPEVGPHAVQRVLDPPLDVVRMQSVHQHEAGDQVVGGERVGELGFASTAMASIRSSPAP